MTDRMPQGHVPTRRSLIGGLAGGGLALVLGGCQSSRTAATGSSQTAARTLAAPPEATQPQRAPVQGASASFRFGQLLGVPADRADDLATRIGLRARARGLSLLRREDASASYLVLGYLSAVGDDRSTTVSYVWDVIGAGNRRLHRITGFELSGGAGGDPWAGVSNEALDAVAARTVEALAAWTNLAPPAAGAAPAVVAAGGTAI